jgi:LPS export ABC transporter protein LptC
MKGHHLYFVFIITLVFISCEANDLESSPIVEREEIAAQIIDGGAFQYSEMGEIKNLLEAGRLERWENDGELWLVSDGFTLYIEGDKENHEAMLSGGRGNYDAKKGHLIAWDDVVLINSKGERLSTEYLVWSNDSDRVHTNRPVTIVTSSGTLHGKGLEADSRFENYRIIDPVGSFEIIQ